MPTMIKRSASEVDSDSIKKRKLTAVESRIPSLGRLCGNVIIHVYDETDPENFIERVVPSAILIHATGKDDGYWRTALSRHFRDSYSGIFKFPSDDPTSWDEFFDYINPGIIFKPQMSVDKAAAVLPWAHLFMISDLVYLCDNAHATHIADLADVDSILDGSTSVRFALDTFIFAFHYGLNDTVKKVYTLICEYMHLGRKALSIEYTERIIEVLVFLLTRS